MLDLRLEYLGGGKFQTRARLDFELCTDSLNQGDRIRAKITKQRSVRQNDFYHALIQAAFESQRAGPRFATWKHLKAWCLCQDIVGHCEEERIPLLSLRREDVPQVLGLLAASWRRRTDFCVTSYDQKRHELVQRFAKSVSFQKADHDQMSHITDGTVTLLCTEIVPGTSPDEIFKMANGITGKKAA